LSRRPDYQLVRNKNRYLVLQTLWNRAPITREEIASLTGLSNPTVQAALRDFKSHGLLSEVNRRESTGGRPAAELALNPEAAYALAAWLSVPTMRAAVLDLRGNVVATAECRLARETTTPAVLALLTAMLRDLVKRAGIRMEKICGIGIAASGVIDAPRGISVSIERLEEWRDVAIGEYLDQQFGLPVILTADTQSALAAELVLGMQRSPGRAPPQSALFILIREGLGDSLILNGRLHDGSHGNAGFMGHMCLDVTGPICTCGARGCLETYVSELAITREVARRLAAGESSTLLIPGDISIAQVELAYAQGDPLVRQVIEVATDRLALGIANAIKLVQPEIVILSTSFLYTDETTLARLTAACERYLAKMQTDPVVIVPASVECDAQLKGVGIITLERAVTNALALAHDDGLMEVAGLPVPA
jgi:predicted NBD/HSP70 family sugar kinase